MAPGSPFDRIVCARGDLTLEDVDAIVNAANEGLRGGGGVDGAIHRAAGPELLAECVRLHPDGCPTGDVRLTRGHRLRARHVIHAVGPVWRGGSHGEEKLLASCYSRAVDLAAREGLRTLAFPAISCGIYSYPWEEAARVSIAALAGALERHESIERARMVLFGDDLLAIFESTHVELARSWNPPGRR